MIKYARCNAEWSNCYYKNFDANKMLKELYSYEFDREASLDMEDNEKEMEVIRMFERNRR